MMDILLMDPERQPWLREETMLASWSGPFQWLSHVIVTVKRGLKIDFVHLCETVVTGGETKKR